jgi:hypothetical protein
MVRTGGRKSLVARSTGGCGKGKGEEMTRRNKNSKERGRNAGSSGDDAAVLL